MKLQAQARVKLLKLAQSGTLPSSQCSRTLREFLAPLIAGGVLEWQRKGAGRQLVVTNKNALNGFYLKHFPDVSVPSDAKSRVSSVGNFRDSKAVKNDGSEIISLRAWAENALSLEGKPVRAATAAAAHGVFSFLLARDCPYELHGKCALVENPAVFTAAEQLKLNLDAVIYGSGRISNRALDWLAHEANSDFHLFHLPDYDPVGLSEFERLRARLDNRVELYLPSDLGIRFARFSNKELLNKINSQALLARLHKSKLPEILQVVELIDQHNAGLEQEALLVQMNGGNG